MRRNLGGAGESRHYHGRFVLWLALGYFGSYTLYSLTVKSLSLAALPQYAGAAGWSLLPGVAVGAGVVVSIASLMLWRLAPSPGGDTDDPVASRITGLNVFVAGMGTMLIVATTTLAYSFAGVSILLALVLMRGGVLMLSPLLDTVFGFRISLNSFLALLLSLGAVLVAIHGTSLATLNAAVLTNLCLYLLGYTLRLPVMNKIAKRRSFSGAVRYFIAEQAVCYPALLIALLLVAVSNAGEIGPAVRDGFLGIWASDGLTSVMIGGLYGLLFVFGTLIYLDPRENTFCIPLNRSASVLAGIIASFIIANREQNAVMPHELVGGCLVLVAMALLVQTTSRAETTLPERRYHPCSSRAPRRQNG